MRIVGLLALWTASTLFVWWFSQLVSGIVVRRVERRELERAKAHAAKKRSLNA